MAHLVEENGRTILRDDWHMEDVFEAAEGMGVKLTDDEAHEVMVKMESSFDANIGINWEYIQYCIEWVKL